MSAEHTALDSVAKTPYFLETISCLKPILGEPGELGRNTGWNGLGKIATNPNEFQESSSSRPRSPNKVHFGLRNKDNLMTTQLPTVVVDEFLDRLPLRTAESNGWKSKIDQTGYLNMLRDPEQLLDLRLATGRGGPVHGQARRET